MQAESRLGNVLLWFNCRILASTKGAPVLPSCHFFHPSSSVSPFTESSLRFCGIFMPVCGVVRVVWRYNSRNTISRTHAATPAPNPDALKSLLPLLYSLTLPRAFRTLATPAESTRSCGRLSQLQICYVWRRSLQSS